jgi:ankyrin repeat protein
MWTAIHGFSEAAGLLLDNGASANEKDRDGRTTLMRGAAHAHTAVVQRLLDADATPYLHPKQKGRPDIIQLAFLGHLKGVETHLQADIPATAKNRQGVTALMAAAHSGHAPTLQALLDAGANPDSRDQSGATALLRAAAYGQAAAIEALLAAGANPNQTNGTGFTRLPHAVVMAPGTLIEKQRALDPGAQIKKKNKGGTSALMWAAAYGNHASVQHLLDGGARSTRSIATAMRHCIGPYARVVNQPSVYSWQQALGPTNRIKAAILP